MQLCRLVVTVGAGVIYKCGFRLDFKCAPVSEGSSQNVWVIDCPTVPSTLSKGPPSSVSSDDFAVNLSIPGYNPGHFLIIWPRSVLHYGIPRREESWCRGYKKVFENIVPSQL